VALREQGPVLSAHVLQRLMRHSSIKTTMDYYANIDAAVEEAVLGDRRNSSAQPTEPSEHNSMT
jgi:hypothetical protein